MVYCTYLGTSVRDGANGVAVDAAKNAYVTGQTKSTELPTSVNAFQPSYAGGSLDSFVMKLNADRSELVYCTYLGGSGGEVCRGIAVDSAGNAYAVGLVNSTDFPTANAFQPTCGGGVDAFMAKLSPDGSALLYSTYLGGRGLDYSFFGIAADAFGGAYVTGTTLSTDFPVANAFQSDSGGYVDAFVAKIDTNDSGLKSLVYSSYLGGSGLDAGGGIAVDHSGNVYLSGETESSDFPTANPLQPDYGGGGGDAFIAKLIIIPVANAGGPYIVPATSWDGAMVTLDGSQSYDPDGDPLSYSWKIRDEEIGTAAALDHQFPIGLTETVSLTVTDPYGHTDTDITTVTVTVIDVDIDIKPGSYPNSINLGSKGVVPVAFLTDAEFDAATIDPGTVTMAGHDFFGFVRMRGKASETSMADLKDVDGDGDLDLVVQLETENLALEPTDTICVLGALTYDGLVVQGEDTVCIVPE